MKREWLLFWIALGLVTIFYAPQIVTMSAIWWDNADYNHAFLVIPIAIGVVIIRRKDFSKLTPSGSWLGLPLLLGGLAMSLLSLPGLFDYPANVAIIPIVGGLVLMLLGMGYLRRLWFPILFLIFMVPIPNVVYQNMAVPLQLLASKTAIKVLNNIEIPTTSEDTGNQIILKDVKVVDKETGQKRPFIMEVATACSGIRSLLAMTCLGAIVVYMLRDDWPSRIFIFLSSVPIAILLNVFRVTTTGILAAKVNTSMAGGDQHELWGLITFALGFAILLAEGKVIDWIFVPLKEDRAIRAQRAMA